MVAGTLVKDLMVALSAYAVVDASATLVDAIRALDAAQAHLPAGRHLHRAVLVRQSGRIVGTLGHFSFLEALLRNRERIFRSPLLDTAGVSEEMVATSMGHLAALTGDLGGPCERGRHVRVGDVMRPIAHRIPEDATLQTALEMLVQNRALSLPVVRGPEIVGVLRSADVFAEVARVLRGWELEKD